MTSTSVGRWAVILTPFECSSSRKARLKLRTGHNLSLVATESHNQKNHPEQRCKYRPQGDRHQFSRLPIPRVGWRSLEKTAGRVRRVLPAGESHPNH
jgi:hypothetical protein